MAAFLIFSILPLGVSIWSFLKIHRLQQRMLHDQLLYSFCEVRDATAALVLEGKITEESSAFKFFYGASTLFVHHHAKTPCFIDLCRRIDAVPSGETGADSTFNDTKAEIDETQELKPIAARFWDTLMKAYELAKPAIFMDRQMRRRYHYVSKLRDDFLCPILERLSIKMRGAS